MDIMLMPNLFKEHRSICCLLIKGSECSVAKTTDAGEAPVKRAGGDRVMHAPQN